MITVKDYFMGRDLLFPHECTDEIRRNATETVRRVNLLLERFGESRAVNSGWRPAAVNASTPGSAKRSNHMMGLACDLDDDDGYLDEWCMDNLDILEEIGLWMEHPSATKGWCHVQMVPPRSGRRVYYP